MYRFLASVIVCAGVGTATAGDWTQFRGSDSTGVADEKGLPVEWSATWDKDSGKATESKGFRWVADLPGRGLSNPVIAGGRVFLTACSGYQNTRLHVLCYDQANGKKLWERQYWATGGTACHPKTSMAAPTPCTDGEHVYALFATADLAALDKDGNLLGIARSSATIRP